MKSNKIYLVTFTGDYSDISGDDFSAPIYERLSNCLDEEDHKYIGFTNSGNIFLQLDNYKLSQMLIILADSNFEFSVKDVSVDVINGSMSIKYPEVQVLTPGIFDNFRIDNTNIDYILDKILEFGINSVDSVDRLILQA